MLRGAETSTALTLSEDEQHALNIKKFRSGCCGYVTDDCQATHDLVFPPSEVRQSCPVETAAWMQKKGFNLYNCCCLTEIISYPVCLLTYGVGVCDGNCYTLSTKAGNIIAYTCCASCPPMTGAAVMLWGGKNTSTGLPEKSYAERIDEWIVTRASNKWREAAHTQERTALLDKPQAMAMRLGREVE
jgi:hypothetical protein